MNKVRIYAATLIFLLVTGCDVTVVEQKDERVKGTVVHVVDGDTFDVQIEGVGEERVRPILIDTPEICHWNSPKDCEPEPFGDEAAAYTEDLLMDEVVYLEKDVSERDRYDRMLFYVYLEDGRMLQEILLKEGLAEVAVFKPDIRYQSEFESIEEQAKNEKKGVWK